MQCNNNNYYTEWNEEAVPDDSTESIFSDTERAVSQASDLVRSGAVELSSVVVESEESPDQEEARIDLFLSSGCSCQYGPRNTPCHRLFSAAQYREMRDECRELTRDELDLVIMGQLRALTLRDSCTQGSKRAATTRVQTQTQFRFGGHQICMKTFCFLHNIGLSKLKAIKASWLENGLRPRPRKSCTPHNTTSLSDVENVVRFILNYAEENAILLPGRIPGYKRDDLQLLPSSTTKREVWQLYHHAATGSRVICYSLFCQLWRKLTPHIVVTKPMSDLCWTCQKNSNLIMRSHNRPVEEKTEVIKFTHIVS